MAPKNKFTRREMIEAALNVVRKSGIETLTAKSLANELGVSTQPVFTCFSSMDVLKEEVRRAAEEVYNKYAKEGLASPIPFLGYGLAYIRFAKEEPQLYKVLFMFSGAGGLAMKTMEDTQKQVSPILKDFYKITDIEACFYFRNLWLVAHSIATLCVSDGCPYTDKEIEGIFVGFSVSICKSIKEINGFAEGTYDKEKVFRSLVYNS